MLLETSTRARLDEQTRTGRTHARPDGTGVHDYQGEVLEAPRSRREPVRDARLLLRRAAAPAPERQAWHRRRGDREEAAGAPVHVDAAAGGKARRPTPPLRGG